MASETYASAHAEWNAGTPFAPPLPVQTLPWLAAASLTIAFGLGFYFTTLPKSGPILRELGVAMAASAATGLGVVAAFNSVGLPV